MKLRWNQFLVLALLSTVLTACHAGSKTNASEPPVSKTKSATEVELRGSSPMLQKQISAEDKKTLIASLFKATKKVYPKLEVMNYALPWEVESLNFVDYFSPDLIEPMQKARIAVLNTPYGYCDKDVLGGPEAGESLTIFDPDADGNVQAATYYAKNLEMYTPIMFVFEGNKIKDIRRMDTEAEASYRTKQVKPIDPKLFSKETLKERIAASEACFKLPAPK